MRTARVRPHRGRPRRLEPYAWLSAGAVGLGIGAAALVGAGAAHADDGAGESSPSASSSSEAGEQSGSPQPRHDADAEEAGEGTDERGSAGSDPPDPPPTPEQDRAESESEPPVESASSTTSTKRRNHTAAESDPPETTAPDPPPATAAGPVGVDDPQRSTFEVPGSSPRRDAGAATISAAAANTPPSGELSRQSSPGWWTGRVTGRISATDADGDRLTYAGMTTAKGTVAVTTLGSFTYTPTAAARHAAASTNPILAADADAFVITVTDGRGGVGTVPVTVPISPTNSAPSRLRFTVGQPDPSSGRVTGAVTATDRDGDTFTYSATAAPNGAVLVGPDGVFTYTPSPAARLRARVTWYTDTDRFRIAVDDGHGATRTIAIRVRIGSGNSAPVAGTPTFGTPDAVTGAVSGSVNTTDPDGDRITFTLSSMPPKGRLTIGGDGAFVYTPNADARHAAATRLPGTTTDTATIIARDSLGAATSIPLTVTILPRNTAPTNARATVGQPDSCPAWLPGRSVPTMPTATPSPTAGRPRRPRGA